MYMLSDKITMANCLVYVVLVVLCHFYIGEAKVVTDPTTKELTTRKGYKDNDGCDCVNSQCVCCARIDINEINVHLSLCMTVAYIPADVAVKLEISIDGNVILDINLSAKNPPPVCFEIPGLSDLASFCLILYDFDVKDNQFSGCARIEVKFLFFLKAHIPLGCFTIPVGDESKIKSSLNSDQGHVHGEKGRLEQDSIEAEQDGVHTTQSGIRNGQSDIRIIDVKVYKAGKYEAKLLNVASSPNAAVTHTAKHHVTYIGVVCALFMLYVK